MNGRDFRRIEIIVEALRKHREFQELIEGVNPFVIYRADTNAVLARGIYGYEQAKNKANELRRKHNLKWDQVKFRVEKRKTKSYPSGNSGRIDYATRYNPSKGRHFRGRYDAQGNYADID